MNSTTVAQQISDAQSAEEKFLRQIFIRSQMQEFVEDPLLMAKAEDVWYEDVNGKR